MVGNGILEGRTKDLSMGKAAVVFIFLFGILGPSRTFALLGDIPTVNTVQGTSNINLNFSTAASNQQIGLFLVNSNDSTGFHITFTFQNKGFFKVGTHQFVMTNLVLNKVAGSGGALGGGLTEPVNVPIVLDGAGSWTWSPCPPAPTTETDSYFIEIKADWADPASGIAGFYKEKINAVIVSGP